MLAVSEIGYWIDSLKLLLVTLCKNEFPLELVKNLYHFNEVVTKSIEQNMKLFR